MSETALALASLQSGTELKLFADAATMEIARSGLFAFAALCACVAIYMFFKQLALFGLPKRSIFGWIGVVLAGLAAYLLFDKAQAYMVIDDKEPVLTITAQQLDYDVRRHGWKVNWADIRNVELNSETTQKKQSVAQTLLEVRVHVKEGAGVTWKYEPKADNDAESVKSLFNASRYLVINPEPLGIRHKELADALEKYRAGR